MKKKRILIFKWNGVLPGVAEELRKRGHEVTYAIGVKNREDIKDYDTIVHWNESGLGESRQFIKYMQRWNKKVIMYQHGRRGTPRILPPFNEELISDVVCVWGENDRKNFLSVGTDDSRIKVVGTPIFQHMKPREEHEGTNLVFSPEHWDTDVVENQIIAGTLRKLRGVKITTKLLKDEHVVEWFDNPVISDRRADNHLDIMANVLKTADIVVSPVESTFELMAQYLDIPVVISGIWIPKACRGDTRYEDSVRVYTPGCKMITDIDKLNETIYHQLKHPDELKAERYQSCIDDGGVQIEDPVKAICDVIEL